MQSNFKAAIDTHKAPPLISVNLSTARGWAYNSTGHTMVISGKRDDLEELRVADPYIQWVSSSASMTYTKSAADIRTAIADRGIGYIY